MIQIPFEIIHGAQVFFSNAFIQAAEKLIVQSRVIISFKKGDFDHYCVVSGLIKSERSHEAKFAYKKRFENTEEGPLFSNCDCNLWAKEHHCPHTCALFLAYSLEKYLLKINPELASQFETTSALPPLSHRNIGVSPDEYGTIIDSPQRLNNAGANASYQSLYYNLHNNRIMPFQCGHHFDGRLIFKINTNQFDQEIHGIHTNLTFCYKNKNNVLQEKISIFENLYLYNWEDGQGLELTHAQKSLVQKIRNNKYTWSTNDYIEHYFLYNKQNFNDHENETNIGVILNHVEIEKIPIIHPHIRFKVQSAAKANIIDENTSYKKESKNVLLDIEFFDENEKICPPPKVLSQFSFSGGHLDGFRKKIEAYDFIKTFTHNIEYGGEEYKKSLTNCTHKTSFQASIDQLFILDHNFYFYEDVLYSYDNLFIKNLFIQLKKCFQETIFRFSEFNHELFSYSMRLPAIDFLNGLSSFQKFSTPFGCQIFYEKDHISTWSSRVKFERRASTTKWFDLEIALGEDDLDVVRNADLSTGISITNKGLILLTEDQKEFIKFVKKFIKEETKLSAEADSQSEEPKKLKKYLLPFNKARMFEIFELQKFGLDNLLTAEELIICKKLLHLEEVPSYPIPVGLENILRPYQITGYHWLKFLYENKLGACLADDMGLGKTLQAITFLQSIYNDISKVLIICPVTILINWEKEITKFSTMKAKIYHGGSRSLDGEEKIILTSFGVLKKEHETTLAQYTFDVLILDEVQHLKNLRSLGAFAARSIKANFHICLTGTPVENDLAEFYNILDLSVPGIWGDLQIVRVISNTESRSLARKTSAPFILRRTKSQVLTELPPKTENTIVLSFPDEEQKNYNQKLVMIRNRIQNSPSQRKYGEILKGLLELRQACLWQTENNIKPASISKVEEIHSVKVDFLMEQIEEILAEGHQAIIFSQFTTYLDIIQKHFDKKMWKAVRIDGTQSLKKRQEQVDLFQENKVPLFLISLKAGGVGLNLTAASYVFIMDPWWNPAVESQAIDRAHRIGQQNNITVYRPIIKSSVEEKVLELQVLKKQLFHELLPDNDDTAFTGKLSMKDFEFLFEKE